MLMRIFGGMTLAMLVSFAQAQEPLDLTLRRQIESASGEFRSENRPEQWQPDQTAIIVCDTWDSHHCFNAVKRLEQFAPRLNQVLNRARERGVTIIHAPSDCMPAYAGHAARKRAQNTTKATFQPHGIKNWCSSIPAEERAVYPIDQSDGGEDDDPAEHAKWAANLKAMGRDPGTPWKTQSDLISIDSEKDYISDRGDEIWNILEHNGIKNVILTGVHTNMCVLGRPFGLRQMVRSGKHAVLMRDMTDTMYNPKRWPYVSHFEGTRRVIAHVERFVCPTISSDQLIGGKEFRFAGDDGTAGDSKPADDHWQVVNIADENNSGKSDGHHWFRCVVYVPETWTQTPVRLIDGDAINAAWCDGKPLKQVATGELYFESIEPGDYHLLVVRSTDERISAPTIRAGAKGDQWLSLAGNWQYRQGDDESLATIPLPAKFGGSADIVFAPSEPLWTPRPLTRKDEFTPGIEGPACDADGNLFAVNFAEQGTIGRVGPDGVGDVFVRLPDGSIGNGIRFDRDGNFFVADYTKHNILKVNAKTRKVTVHAHNDQMNQPNDLAIADDGTLYASDPNWKKGTGQLWRIDTDGTTTRLAKDMGTTNGIEVSPDGKTLYVNESKQLNLWAFDISPDKSLTNKRLLRKFPDHGFDGMRCDVDGNLYIARYGKGVIAKVSPSGQVLREIPVLGARPSNVCFGGPDGRTMYVTEVDWTRVVTFRVDRPGRSHRQ